MPALIIFSGLPGTGKTAIARELAREIGAVYLRIDSIEQAMRDCGPFDPPLDRAGYEAAYAVAEDNLRIGRIVVADSANLLAVTRNAWIDVARRAGVLAIEVEVRCSDAREHRRRIEQRATDIPGLKLPTWQQVLSREHHPWDRDHIVIDTAVQTMEQAINLLKELIAKQQLS